MSAAFENGSLEAAPPSLSVRLQTVFSLVPPSRLAADVGCDHGLLAAALVKTGTVTRAVASDLREGPLSRARETVLSEGLQDRIDCRLGDGLKTLEPGEADTVIIAGMGGLLMKRILEEGKEVAESAGTLVLSPHRDVPELRAYLSAAGFRIVKEKICVDGGKYYFVLKAVHEAPGERPEETAAPSAEDEERSLLEKEFGLLLYEQDPVFTDWLKKEKRKAEALEKRLSESAAVPEGDTAAKKEALSRIRARLLLLTKAEALIRQT